MNTPNPSSTPNPAERGEAMMLAFYERRPLSFRPVIFVAPMDNPDDMSELILGRWYIGLKAAQRAGMRLYFDTYATRYGFRHPEDPQAPKREPLPYSVICASDEDAFHLSRTYNPDARTA